MKIYWLTKENWFDIAFIIDGNFGGSQYTFSARKMSGYYYLDSNKCDMSSLIKVNYDPDFNLTSIFRLGDDTDGYKPIHVQTMERVKKYLETLNK